MRKAIEPTYDNPRAEYEFYQFEKGVRGKYAKGFQRGRLHHLGKNKVYIESCAFYLIITDK